MSRRRATSVPVSCIDCGQLYTGPTLGRCAACTSLRERRRNTRNPNGWRYSAMRRDVLADEGARCRMCGAARVTLEVDHIVPLSRGGTHDRSNLRVLCRPCHVRVTGER